MGLKELRENEAPNILGIKKLFILGAIMFSTPIRQKQRDSLDSPKDPAKKPTRKRGLGEKRKFFASNNNGKINATISIVVFHYITDFQSKQLKACCLSLSSLYSLST